MTARRTQVLREVTALVANGQPVRWAELARRCNLYDYRHARRLVKDLREMGALA